MCPETTRPKTNSSPLKMDGWNAIVSFWETLFSGATGSFRECTSGEFPLIGFLWFFTPFGAEKKLQGISVPRVREERQLPRRTPGAWKPRTRLFCYIKGGGKGGFPTGKWWWWWWWLHFDLVWYWMRSVTSHVKWVGISSRWCPTSSIPYLKAYLWNFRKAFDFWPVLQIKFYLLLIYQLSPTFTGHFLGWIPQGLGVLF